MSDGLKDFTFFTDNSFTCIPNDLFKFNNTSNYDSINLLFITFIRELCKVTFSRNDISVVIKYSDKTDKIFNSNNFNIQIKDNSIDLKIYVIDAPFINNAEQIILTYDLNNNELLYYKECIFLQNINGVRCLNCNTISLFKQRILNITNNPYFEFEMIFQGLEKFSNRPYYIKDVYCFGKCMHLISKYRYTINWCIYTLLYICKAKFEKEIILPQEIYLMIQDYFI
jgi:hypothetical protein